MMGSVWPGEDPTIKFYGLVTKKMKFKGRKGDMVNGYEVLWDDGGKERWPYEYLVPALVPTGDPLVSVGDSDEVVTSDEDDEDDAFTIMMSGRDDPEEVEYTNVFN